MSRPILLLGWFYSCFANHKSWEILWFSSFFVFFFSFFKCFHYTRGNISFTVTRSNMFIINSSKKMTLFSFLQFFNNCIRWGSLFFNAFNLFNFFKYLFFNYALQPRDQKLYFRNFSLRRKADDNFHGNFLKNHSRHLKSYSNPPSWLARSRCHMDTFWKTRDWNSHFWEGQPFRFWYVEVHHQRRFKSTKAGISS